MAQWNRRQIRRHGLGAARASLGVPRHFSGHPLIPAGLPPFLLPLEGAAGGVPGVPFRRPCRLARVATKKIKTVRLFVSDLRLFTPTVLDLGSAFAFRQNTLAFQERPDASLS